MAASTGQDRTNAQTFTPPLRQGEHVAVIGPTGTGKTYLAERFLRTEPWAVVLDSKGELRWKGFRRTSTLEPIQALAGSHWIYQPPHEGFKWYANELFELVYRQRGWTVCIDEVYSIGAMDSYIKLLTRGRSRGVTVWTETQRPRWLPLFAFTEAKHFFSFQLDSDDDIKTLAGQTSREFAAAVATLSGHEFVYYNKRERVPHISKALARR